MNRMVGGKWYKLSEKAHAVVLKCLWEMSDSTPEHRIPDRFFEGNPIDDPKLEALLQFLLRDLGVVKDGNAPVPDRDIIEADMLCMSADWSTGYEVGYKAGRASAQAQAGQP